MLAAAESNGPAPAPSSTSEADEEARGRSGLTAAIGILPHSCRPASNSALSQGTVSSGSLCLCCLNQNAYLFAEATRIIKLLYDKRGMKLNEVRSEGDEGVWVTELISRAPLRCSCELGVA